VPAVAPLAETNETKIKETIAVRPKPKKKKRKENMPRWG
jgi:hypothetical protein